MCIKKVATLNHNFTVEEAENFLRDQFVVIPSGQIKLRDDRKKRTWFVEVYPFNFSKFQVTQKLYSAIIPDSKFTFQGVHNPVESVSWNDAIRFCNLLSQREGLTEYYSIDVEGFVAIKEIDADGYRLPTEAEWQYACKAGSTGPRYGAIDDIAWYKPNADDRTHSVGTKVPNAWGLYDMLGNVWEWCWDLYDEKVYGSYRVFRGGGWFDPERGCLATNRRRGHPSFEIDDLGFRIARNFKPST